MKKDFTSYLHSDEDFPVFYKGPLNDSIPKGFYYCVMDKKHGEIYVPAMMDEKRGIPCAIITKGEWFYAVNHR